MKRWVNILAQAAGVIGQLVIPAFVANPKSAAKYAAIIAAVQGIAAIIAHNYNPDGTPAALPYQPNKR